MHLTHWKTACLVTLDKEVKTMKIHLEKQARYDEQLQVRHFGSLVVVES